MESWKNQILTTTILEDNMKVKIKKLHPDAVIPAYAKTGDAGMDLTAVSMKFDEYGNICYGTGLAFEIPEGYVGLVFPRSSIFNKGLVLSNSVGVIDSGYRGEVSFKFKPCLEMAEGVYQPNNPESLGLKSDAAWYLLHEEGNYVTYRVGDRIGQIIIMPYPQIELEEAEELSETERGTGGYGSSGK